VVACAVENDKTKRRSKEKTKKVLSALVWKVC